MVAMHEDTRSKYDEAALEHMKERICDRYIDHPFKFSLQFFFIFQRGKENLLHLCLLPPATFGKRVE